MRRSSSILLALATLTAFMTTPAHGDVQVSGKTYTGSDSKPTEAVKIQAYQHGRSSPVGDPSKSRDTGDYILSIPAVAKFDVVYFHPDPQYLDQILPVRDAFNGSEGKRYSNQDVTFFTPEQFLKKYGKDVYKNHLKRLRESLPNDHPRGEFIKSLLDKAP